MQAKGDIVLVTALRFPLVLATNRINLIDWRDANPCKNGEAHGRSHESEVHGFKSRYFSWNPSSSILLKYGLLVRSSRSGFYALNMREMDNVQIISCVYLVQEPLI